MYKCVTRSPLVVLPFVALVAAACGSNPAKPSGSTSSGTSSSITAPQSLQPSDGAQIQSTALVTLVVQNAVVTPGGLGPTTYTFEVATDSAFTAKVQTKDGVPESPAGQTTVSLDPLPSAKDYYWHARAQSAGVTGTFSATYKFTIAAPVLTRQAQIAAQLGVPLWPGAQPSGTNGHATLGKGWEVRTIVSFNGVTFVSPPIEQLQIFDLIDRGMDPGAAIAWMKSHGYPTTGAYYPSIAVIGFPYEYVTLIGGHWDLVVRVGA